MPKYGIICDVYKCDGCYACFMACKDEYVGNEYLPYSAAQPEPNGQQWLKLKEVEYGTGDKVRVDYLPMFCQHCESMPCARNMPEGAVYRREDGIVMIDPVKAKGLKQIVNQCPYRMIAWNEALQIPQKCTMCAHILDKNEGLLPRCVDTCPTEALVFGDLEDPESAISKLIAEKGDQLEEYKPELKLNHSVKWLNLPKPFIAGEIADDAKDVCIEGATVSLECPATGEIQTTKTDIFGDFAFNKLRENEFYIVTIEADGYPTVKKEVRTNCAKNLGTFFMDKAN